MHIQRLLSVVEMATVFEDCITEEQHSVVRFLLAKGLNAKDIHNVSSLRWEVFVA
jgi:hypothetical protein